MSATAIDTAGFTSMLRDLEKLSGRDFFDILINQVGALIKVCIRLTPVRSIADLARRVSRGASFVEFADGTIISVFKKAGGDVMFLDPSNWEQSKNPAQAAPQIIGGKSWHNMTSPGRRWNPHRWASFTTKDGLRPYLLEKRLAVLKAGRGLAAKSWWQMAEDLGLDPGLAAAYIRNAQAIGPTGGIRPFKEGFAAKIVEQAAAIVELTNTNPLVTGKLGGARIMQNALATRELAFIHELEHGVFEDLQTRAARYPGIFVN